jgi:hypothetical protein
MLMASHTDEHIERTLAACADALLETGRKPTQYLVEVTDKAEPFYA